ncbi:MAG TPA: DUF3126 family protein [Patescibacteria group bacterium]|nr:DUF3126 family protein [Patescibacteria group bacterium]
MSVISSQDMAKLQAYLQKKLGNKELTLRSRGKATDSAEVLLGGEFIGTVYKDEEDGDTSYDFNMAILDIDLAG